MKVNILYLIQFLGHGGTEKQLVQLIRGLEGSPFRPHLCTLMPSGGYFDDLDIPKAFLQFRSFVHPSLVTVASRLASFIRHHDIHIIQTFFQDPFLLGAMIRPLKRVKLIGSLRDLGFWRTPAATGKMRVANPFYSGFIANSQAVKDYFVRADHINSAKIEVIYNGIDLGPDRFPTIKGETSPSPVIGIVANCNRPVKRVHDFIHAAALVHRAWGKAHFMVVGDGPLRPELERLGRTLGLGGSLTFTGQVTSPYDFIRQFSVGVNASESEGFSNAILEYMAWGVPVVATCTGGNPELVREGENGFLVPVGDVESMADRIILLLNEGMLRRKIGEANLTRVSSEFSLTRMISKYQDYYHRVLEI